MINYETHTHTKLPYEFRGGTPSLEAEGARRADAEGESEGRMTA